MDPNAASAPSLIASLEAMIQASVTAVLDRRLGPAGDTLDVQIQTAIAAAIDKRLGPAVGSLGNRMTSLIEQRLGNAVSTLNFRVNASVTAALEQRLGPTGGALTAQITFTAAPPILSSELPPKAQALSEVKGMKETSGNCPAEEESGNFQPMGNGGCEEKEQSIQKQNANGPEAPKTQSPESGDRLSVPPAMPEESNEPTSKETAATHSDASKNALHPLFTNGTSTNKTDPSVFLTAKPNTKLRGRSSSANKTPAKRKANQKDEANKADDTGVSESSSSEEESDNEKPKRKRAKVKLDPPGYTDGPSLKFRRVSPKLTACAKSRGYPRVVDLKGFTGASNKQNLTMADVVATVLFNYDPMSLHAFMDMDRYPTFHFIRKESDCKLRNFVIERRRELYGVVVEVSFSADRLGDQADVAEQCGYHLSQADRTKHCSDPSRIWEKKYKHIILPIGKWVPTNYTQESVISNNSKRTIEQWATEFGTEVFLGRLWVESASARIESDRLVLP